MTQDLDVGSMPIPYVRGNLLGRHLRVVGDTVIAASPPLCVRPRPVIYELRTVLGKPTVDVRMLSKVGAGDGIDRLDGAGPQLWVETRGCGCVLGSIAVEREHNVQSINSHVSGQTRELTHQCRVPLFKNRPNHRIQPARIPQSR